LHRNKPDHGLTEISRLPPDDRQETDNAKLTQVALAELTINHDNRIACSKAMQPSQTHPNLTGTKPQNSDICH
jgi:hypothetical protein